MVVPIARAVTPGREHVATVLCWVPGHTLCWPVSRGQCGQRTLEPVDIVPERVNGRTARPQVPASARAWWCPRCEHVKWHGRE